MSQIAFFTRDGDMRDPLPRISRPIMRVKTLEQCGALRTFCHAPSQVVKRQIESRFKGLWLGSDSLCRRGYGNFGLIDVALAVGLGNHRQGRGAWSGARIALWGQCAYRSRQRGWVHNVSSTPTNSWCHMCGMRANEQRTGRSSRERPRRQRQRCEEVRDEPEHRCILCACVERCSSA
jgi:hypothetical protein